MDLHTLAVIDDEPEIRSILAETMEDNFLVEQFGSADEAMQAVESGKKFDIYVTDIAMPGTNGIEFLKWLRGKEIHNPVIVISGFAEKANALQAIELGSFAMLEKPFNFGTVFSVVNRASAYLLLQQINEELLLRYGELIDTFGKNKPELSSHLASIVDESIAANAIILKQKERLAKIYARLQD